MYLACVSKALSKTVQSVVTERIVSRILQLRGARVMLDLHLAELYEVETRVLKQAVRRNRIRFLSLPVGLRLGTLGLTSSGILHGI